MENTSAISREIGGGKYIVFFKREIGGGKYIVFFKREIGDAHYIGYFKGKISFSMGISVIFKYIEHL